jgi:predicted nucleic acid-binding protein
MLRYMLDTDICIYVIKSHPPKLRERFNRFAEQLCISSISLAEMVYGAEKSARRTCKPSRIFVRGSLSWLLRRRPLRISARCERTSNDWDSRWGRSTC